MNLAHKFLDTLAAQGNRIAITEPNGQQVTFDAVRHQILALAQDLHTRGFQPGDAVVIQVPNGIAFTVATVATLAAGGRAVLCEPGLGDDVYFSRLRAASPRWVLVHPIITWANRIPGVRALLARREILVPPLLPRDVAKHRLSLSNRTLAKLPQPLKNHGATPVIERDTDDDAIVIFTGGTTTMPKGVRLSHGALQHYLDHIAGIAEPLGISRFLADTPQQVLYALSLGRSVLVTRGRTQRRARFVYDAIRQGRIDAYFGSPFLWVEMMAAFGTDARLPDTLKAVLLGGAPVTPDFLRRTRSWLHPNTQVRCLYGLTEAGPVCVATDGEKLDWTGEGDFVGTPLDGVHLAFEARGDSDIGEVIVHSDALYSGYIGQPERHTGEGLRTGDLGRPVTSNGREALVLLGRAKDMIIRAGVNIYPTVFEAALREITTPQGAPLLRECALVGLWNTERQDEEVLLCYEPAENVPVDVGVLRAEVTRITGPDAAPDHYLEVAPMPVTGRQNKLDKRALRERGAATFGLEPEPLRNASS